MQCLNGLSKNNHLSLIISSTGDKSNFHEQSEEGRGDGISNCAKWIHLISDNVIEEQTVEGATWTISWLYLPLIAN